MLLSLALLFLVGMSLGAIFVRIHLPSLIGMLLTGILLGPHVLNLLDPSLLMISTELRQIALIIILTRAGMNLDIRELKKAGRPALLLCFVPACFEILGAALLAPMLFGVTRLEGVLIGTVLAAVSPAVIVPRMLRLTEHGYGTNKAIPQMIMAGASVDDIFVIVLFTVVSSPLQTGDINALQFLEIPTSIALGMAGGILSGLFLSKFFSSYHMRDTIKVVIILSIAFLLVTLDQSIVGPIGFSGLLAVMALGGSIRAKREFVAKRLSLKFSKLWVASEILLFVLVGANVNISYALGAGGAAILLILLALLFRMMGVWISTIHSSLNKKERLFTAAAYIPKATVQAAIGGLPLAMGLASGELILTAAVLSILITAPLGAYLIDQLYTRCLESFGDV